MSFLKDLVKLKDNKYRVTGILWRALKKREKEGDLLVVTIDEYMTSRIFNIYYEDSLRKVDGVKGHSILGCQNCKTLWQRDINAAKNMLLISSLTWNGNGRLEIFSPKARV
jgi:transposase